VRLEDREERLLDAVAQGPGAGAGSAEADAARRAGDDSPGVSHDPDPSRPALRLADPDTLQPALSELTPERRGGRRQLAALVEECLGALARPLRQRDVRPILEGRDPKPRQAALGEAQHVAFAAQLEVALGQLEPVAQLGDRFQPGL